MSMPAVAQPDRRRWLETDRPGERMAISLPLPGVRVLSVSGSDRHCVELHEVHTLCVLNAGQPGIGAHWRSGRKPSAFETGSGDVMVMELGTVHRTTRVHGKVSYSVVQVDPQVVGGLVEQVGMRAAQRVRATSLSHPALLTAVTRFVLAVAEGSESFTLECLLAELTSTWLDLCSEGGVRWDPVLHCGIRRARDAIRDCSSAEGTPECPRLEQLAALSGLSPARFSHAFTEWLGIPPHAYFNVTRLNAARRTLERGRSATEVAASFGFADLPHFSRHFRRQFGLSPRAWMNLSNRRA